MADERRTIQWRPEIYLGKFSKSAKAIVAAFEEQRKAGVASAKEISDAQRASLEQVTLKQGQSIAQEVASIKKRSDAEINESRRAINTRLIELQAYKDKVASIERTGLRQLRSYLDQEIMERKAAAREKASIEREANRIIDQNRREVARKATSLLKDAQRQQREAQTQQVNLYRATASALQKLGFAGRQFFRDARQDGEELSVSLVRLKGLLPEIDKEENFARIVSAINKMPPALGTTTDAVKVMTDVIQARAPFTADGVFKINDAVAITSKTLQLAAIDGSSYQDVLRAALPILNSFKGQIQDVGKFFDDLLLSQERGRFKFREFGHTLNQLAPQVRAVGGTYQEMLAILSQLTLTLGAARGGTGLASALDKLGIPIEKAQKAANRLGFELGTTAIKGKGLANFIDELIFKSEGSSEILRSFLVDIRGQRAALALATEGTGEYNRTLADFSTSTERASARLGEFDGTLAKTVASARNQSANFRAEIAQDTQAFVEAQFTVITKLREAYESIPAPARGVAAVVAEVASNLGIAAGEALIFASAINGPKGVVTGLKGLGKLLGAGLISIPIAGLSLLWLELKSRLDDTNEAIGGLNDNWRESRTELEKNLRGLQKQNETWKEYFFQLDIGNQTTKLLADAQKFASEGVDELSSKTAAARVVNELYEKAARSSQITFTEYAEALGGVIRRQAESNNTEKQVRDTISGSAKVWRTYRDVLAAAEEKSKATGVAAAVIARAYLDVKSRTSGAKLTQDELNAVFREFVQIPVSSFLSSNTGAIANLGKTFSIFFDSIRSGVTDANKIIFKFKEWDGVMKLLRGTIPEVNAAMEDLAKRLTPVSNNIELSKDTVASWANEWHKTLDIPIPDLLDHAKQAIRDLQKEQQDAIRVQEKYKESIQDAIDKFSEVTRESVPQFSEGIKAIAHDVFDSTEGIKSFDAQLAVINQNIPRIKTLAEAFHVDLADAIGFVREEYLEMRKADEDAAKKQIDNARKRAEAERKAWEEFTDARKESLPEFQSDLEAIAEAFVTSSENLAEFSGDVENIDSLIPLVEAFRDKWGLELPQALELAKKAVDEFVSEHEKSMKRAQDEWDKYAKKVDDAWLSFDESRQRALPKFNEDLDKVGKALAENVSRTEKFGVSTRTLEKDLDIISRFADEWGIEMPEAIKLAEGAVEKFRKEVEKTADKKRDIEELGSAFESVGLKLSKFQSTLTRFKGFKGISTPIIGGGGLGGFHQGGSFVVGGAPGVDRNVVAFKASRNERVTVEPPGSGGIGQIGSGTASLSTNGNNVRPMLVMNNPTFIGSPNRAAAEAWGRELDRVFSQGSRRAQFPFLNQRR